MNAGAVARPASGVVTVGQIAHAVGGQVAGDQNVALKAVRQDSRRVEPQDLFVARAGQQADGARFIRDAIEKGAVAIMLNEGGTTDCFGVPIILVHDIRTALDRAAALVAGNPTERLSVIGITGTNGKTTTSYLVQTALDGCGQHTGVLGTLGAHFGGYHVADSTHTTPQADEVQRIAAAMLSHGATHLVMEVSSHALDQRRADSVHFRVAAYTNLTQDHLDYHGTMQAYAQAKSRLFGDLKPACAAIMTDDDFGESLAKTTTCPVLTVSRRQNAAADICPVSRPVLAKRGIECEVRTPDGIVHLDSPLAGEHNLSNLLLAIAIVRCLDLPVERAIHALGGNVSVPGRLERCDEVGDDICVLVDYAHTPDALGRAIGTIRTITTGQVLCVFGCGGDRDRAKRPLMGEVASRLADKIWVTSDNPRSEDPSAIIDQIISGIGANRSKSVVQPDRARAIADAVLGAKSGDVVLIAGKGHETYQIVGAQVREFDDREHARLALELRRNLHTRGKE